MFDLGRTLIAAVEREPGALAVVDGDVRLTYAEWLDRIFRVAGGLAAQGLRRGDHVLIAMQNRWEMATVHWACQMAGLIATPVNWRAKNDEIDFFLSDSESRAIVFEPVTAEAVGQSAVAAKIPRIAVGGAVGGTVTWDDLLSAASVPGMGQARPEDISVMLYTSGTTGRGKGVPRTHRAERAAAVAHVAQNMYRYGERTLGVMPLYHTMGVRSLLAMALINGALVCLPRFDVGRALDLIASEKITNLYLVPTLYHDLLAHPGFNSERVSTVRKLGFAGASMTDGLLLRLNEAFKPDLFVNHYGSSEIYTFTVCQDAVAKPGSAGKAGIHQDIRVIRLGSTNPADRCAPGEEGQIIAALDGDESFAGYWRRPDADAKALHHGWYLTGDTGHFDAAGDLFVTGRVDDMIISGGENIFPVEIESVLSLHPAVAEVAIAGLPDERWGQKVTAFIKRRGAVSGEALDAYCLESGLANFKRPRDYVFVAEIPKSPVGKILRRKLIAQEYALEGGAHTNHQGES